MRYPLRSLTSVLFILAVLTANRESFAQNACVELFNTRSAETGTTYTDRNERSIMHWLEVNRRQKETGEVVVESLGRKYISKMSEEQRARLPDPEVLFSAQIMKPLGKLFRLEWDPSRRRVIEIPDPAEIERQKAFYAKELAELSTEIAPEFRTLLKKVLKIEEISPDATMISINPVIQIWADPREQALAHRMMNYYINTVSYIYRFSELEPNQVRTNAKMLDEIAMYGERGQYFNFHLLFDKATWSIQERYLQKYYLDLAKADFEDHWEFQPFLPFAGVVTTETFTGPRKPVEIKRYFRNHHEDPLQLAHTREKDELRHRILMLRAAINDLAPQSEIEVHAHQESQMRLYVRMGLSVTETIENPKYPGVKVYVLRGQREKLLAGK